MIKFSKHVSFTSPTMIPLIVSAGPQIGFESSSSSSEFSICWTILAIFGGSLFSTRTVVVNCVVDWIMGGGIGWFFLLTTSLLLLILKDFRGGIGGASSCAIAIILALLTLPTIAVLTKGLFDICSTSIDAVLLLVVDEHVDEDKEDEDEVFKDDCADVDGVVCAAFTTIVFGTFPFITLTFTTLTTVVLLIAPVVMIGFDTTVDVDGIWDISILLVNAVTVDDDVTSDVVVVVDDGIVGTFLKNFGDVWGLWMTFSLRVSVKLLLSACIDDSSKLNSVS